MKTENSITQAQKVDSLKEWYTSAHPSDYMGHKISNLTFVDLAEGLKNGADIYEVIGVADSLIRERLFAELAELLRVDYKEVYSLWLHSSLLNKLSNLR